jgi:hypothetical protein
MRVLLPASVAVERITVENGTAASVLEAARRAVANNGTTAINDDVPASVASPARPACAAVSVDDAARVANANSGTTGTRVLDAARVALAVSARFGAPVRVDDAASVALISFSR